MYPEPRRVPPGRVRTARGLAPLARQPRLARVDFNDTAVDPDVARLVASLEGVRTPSLVAKAVMEMTDHHLLVGPGAQEFARNMGFTRRAGRKGEGCPVNARAARPVPVRRRPA